MYLLVYMEHGVLLSIWCANTSVELTNEKLGLHAFCFTQTGSLLLT